MFESSVYVKRRHALLEQMAARMAEGARGIAVFLGNVDAPANYRGNDYKFRQDSSFLYFWGIDEPGFAAILDLDTAEECLYGNDVDIDDIIWMGPQPSVASKGALIGCPDTAPLSGFFKAVSVAVAVEEIVVLYSRHHSEILFAVKLCRVDKLKCFFVSLAVHKLKKLRCVFVHF